MDTTKDIITNSLTSADRCDSCGAQAYVQVFLSEGDLLFCGHHFKENEDKLVTTSVRIYDELYKLQPSKLEPEDVE